jgi:hypothetical protein
MRHTVSFAQRQRPPPPPEANDNTAPLGIAAEAIRERKLASAPKAPPPQRRAGNAPPIARHPLPGAGTFRAYAPCPRRRVHPSRDGRVPDRLGRGAPPRRLRLHIDAIAARAGTCRTTVKNALREARRLNLVTVQERRRRGQRSLTNIIHIISREWRDWLQHERQKRRQAEFVTDEEQRLLEIEDMRLVVKFGEKRRYSDRERQSVSFLSIENKYPRL